MAAFTISTTLDQPYDTAVEAVRGALSSQGFGILTEIDLKATLKAKLDVDVDPQVILGACMPQLAQQEINRQRQFGRRQHLFTNRGEHFLRWYALGQPLSQRTEKVPLLDVFFSTERRSG